MLFSVSFWMIACVYATMRSRSCKTDNTYCACVCSRHTAMYEHVQLHESCLSPVNCMKSPLALWLLLLCAVLLLCVWQKWTYVPPGCFVCDIYTVVLTRVHCISPSLICVCTRRCKGINLWSEPALCIVEKGNGPLVNRLHFKIGMVCGQIWMKCAYPVTSEVCPMSSFRACLLSWIRLTQLSASLTTTDVPTHPHTSSVYMQESRCHVHNAIVAVSLMTLCSQDCVCCTQWVQ